MQLEGVKPSYTKEGIPKTVGNPLITKQTTSTSNPESVPQAESVGNKVTQRLKREAHVSLLGQKSLLVDMSANVLPTLPIDPRSNTGDEVIRISNGTAFSGEYLLTEVITTYSAGKRSRQISGIGVVVDGLNISNPEVDNGKAGSVTNKPQEPNPTKGDDPNATPDDKANNAKEVYFDSKTGQWKRAK